jgi:hypothetical protein
MRPLKSKTNVTAPSSIYPYGRIKDNPGDGSGTPVNEQVYGDIHQFFEKLMADAGMAANNAPESVYDGFQLNEALQRYINITLALEASISWTTSGLSLGSGVTNTSFRFKKTYRNTIKLDGRLTKVAGVNGFTFATLPIGYRPSVDKYFSIPCFGFLAGPGWSAYIATSGDISIYENGPAAGPSAVNLSGSNYCFETIEFDL